MERVEQARQISKIYNGEMTVNDAHKDVQAWFEITVYSLALGIAYAPIEKRKAIVDDMKKTNPDWVDDVLPIARTIIQNDQAPRTK